VHNIVKFLLRRPRNTGAEDRTIDEALRNQASPLRSTDLQTHQQWMRLQRTIQHADSALIRPQPRLMPRLAVGIAALAVIAGAFYLYTLNPGQPATIFATQLGEQKEVVLGDGSHVTLNYGSEIVASSHRPNEARRLTLTGEAFFKVQHTGTPFIISTPSAEIEVVGTEFNVRERSGTVEIGVLSGAVKVRVMKDGKDSTLLLTQHQMALCVQNGFPARTGSITSPEYPGWMHGKLFLDKMTLAAACRELELRFGVTIDVRDHALRARVITGILDAGTATSGIAALCELTGRKFTHAGKTYLVD
jgi:transmembrane sensor